jgi:hypothetical protein
VRGGSFLVSFVTRHASTRREGRPTEGRETVHGHNVACGRWEQEGKKKEKKIISPSSTQFDGKGKHRFVLSSRPLSLSLSLSPWAAGRRCALLESRETPPPPRQRHEGRLRCAAPRLPLRRGKLAQSHRRRCLPRPRSPQQASSPTPLLLLPPPPRNSSSHRSPSSAASAWTRRRRA